ncbi:MAG: Ig-like domain-containing protein [Polyangia bacterium]|jgi:hypothetical protein|nr:Ig-like domain-containing protein [Polyangia bacterium]
MSQTESKQAKTAVASQVQVPEPGPSVRRGGARTLCVLGLLGLAAFLSVATSAQRPVIERVTPAMGDSSVAVDQPIEVVFERPLDPATASSTTVRIRRLGDEAILEASIDLSEGNRRLTLRPSARLEAATDYALELDLDSLKSEDGETFAGLRFDQGSQSVWETSGVLSVPFTTRRELTVARAFLQADPSEIWIYFSEPVDPASITLESLSLEAGGEGLAFDLRFSEAENRLRVIPLGPLGAETSYQIRLAASISTPDGAALGGGEGDLLELDLGKERIR